VIVIRRKVGNTLKEAAQAGWQYTSRSNSVRLAIHFEDNGVRLAVMLFENSFVWFTINFGKKTCGFEHKFSYKVSFIARKDKI